MTTKEKFSTSDRNRLTDLQLSLYTINVGFFCLCILSIQKIQFQCIKECVLDLF